MKTDKLLSRAAFSILIIAFCSIFLTCRLFGPKDDPEDQTEDTPSGGVFSWSSPDLPEESIFTMGTVEEESSGTRFVRSASRWAVSADETTGGKALEPDVFTAAYSYIGLVPEDIVLDMAEVGFQAYRRGSGLIDEDTLDHIDTRKIPGYADNANPGDPPAWDGGNPVFEAYVDENSPVTRNHVKNSCFTLYDSTEHGGELKVFDVSSGNTKIEIGELPDDLDISYTGVASQLVYYETALDGYGTVRFYFNDAPPCYAGDVTVKKEGETSWKWAYLKHGDGIDADCFSRTSDDPVYDDVYAPDDPDNPQAEHSWQTYNGFVDLQQADNADESTYSSSYPNLYAFIYDFDMNQYGNGFINGVKRPSPSGSGSYSYLMVSNEIMNTGTGENPDQFTFPHLNLPEMGDIGGYAQHTGNPNTDIPFRDRDGGGESYISGYCDRSGDGEIDNWELEPGDAFVVYHEPDFHAASDDLTHAVYLDRRLDYVGNDLDGDTSNDVLLTREELKKRYGWYSWDSGLYSALYKDGDILYHNRDDYGIILNPLYFALGRMHVYADAPHDTGDGPEYSGSWFDRVISLEVELQLDAELLYEKDMVSRQYGTDGTAVGTNDAEKRFLSYIPAWTADAPFSEPLPRPADFNDNARDDVVELNHTFSVISNRFKINHHYIHYQDAYTLPPQCSPDPADGPFDENIEVSLAGAANVDDQANVVIFYTLNGSEPAVTENADRSVLSAASGSTKKYTESIAVTKSDTPVTLKAVAYERKTWDSDERKERSITKEAVYTFKKPGTTVSFSIQNSSLPNGTPLFAGLFAGSPLDLNAELNPLYSAGGEISGGQAQILVKDVPGGTYYAAVFADTDKSGSMSGGDQIFPKQSGSPAETNTISGSRISVSSASSVNAGSSSWSEY